MIKKITIDGMSCEHCVNHVTEALKELNGVVKVEVSLASNNAIIETSQDVKDGDIKSSIDEAGYEVTGIDVL
ncbi:heavy-metal-associated domain-containing protein [Anaerocolumna chitinilytica]|uniref:HMA domain-containing protein n=1 Tax=Anaerocolumna chitinilytica TaxID=1727145 RepID=A0A7I8DMD9_9FIRM|nr:cation transporter [Anaerocolumna chitinilytica]BCJ98451.1 hypothetical protein bsdcttw_14920 [Anaerocolumna chitinilytica]